MPNLDPATLHPTLAASGSPQRKRRSFSGCSSVALVSATRATGTRAAWPRQGQTRPAMMLPDCDRLPVDDMGLLFHPTPGTLLVCDFATGFRPPEMVKKRPVVSISPRREAEVCTIVPLSTQEPVPIEDYHHPMDPRSVPLGAEISWAKCDMLYTVCWRARLDRPRIDGKYTTHHVQAQDLAAIRECVRLALQLDRRVRNVR